MPIPSQRATSQKLSPIRSLVPHARKAEKDGKNVYYLNIGQPDIPTPAKALDQVKNIDQSIIKYGPSEGMHELRSLVSEYYNSFTENVLTEDILVTTGASEAIIFALMAACDKGDEVIIPEPFYANYLGFSKTCDVDIVPIPTSIDNGFALPSAEAFEKKISKNTKAIFLCNPGNPTGQLYTKEELQKVIKMCVDHQLFLIVDEVYREFCYDISFTSALSFKEAENNVIIIDSISKIFSACGARIGFVVSKNKSLIENIIKIAQHRLCPPHFGQLLAIGCYKEMSTYLPEVIKEYEKRREVLYNGLIAIPGVKCYKPAAAFYNIVELPIDDAEDFCKWMLTDFEFEGSTVMLAPANGFYVNEKLGKRQVRIAYILNPEKLNAALACLSEGLKVYSSIKNQKQQSYSYS